MRVLPKGIANHPGVRHADLDDDSEGCRADVLLKPDWHFAALDDGAGPNDWNVRRTGFFASLREFNEARPEKF